jgi:hypothetical protein
MLPSLKGKNKRKGDLRRRTAKAERVVWGHDRPAPISTFIV